MKKIISVMFLFLAAAAVLFMLLYPSLKKENKPKVTNFKECAEAGYPVMESYPRQCTLPSGNFFVEPFVESR